jgi:putative ABC transport system ATP-binding protein
MAEPDVFRFEDVSLVSGEGASILDHVVAEVPASGVTVLAGPSGAGKTTLLRLCNRLEVPTSGRVLFHGDDVAHLDPLAHRRRVGMVFQRPTLFPGTVRDNLHVADRDADETRLREVLGLAALDASFLDRTGDDLSGGEAQRTCIARALLTNPQVLLMDEPTSALDPEARRSIEALARRLAERGLTLIWVSHDLDQVARIADRTIVLVGGRVADPAEAARFLATSDPSRADESRADESRTDTNEPEESP